MTGATIATIGAWIGETGGMIGASIAGTSGPSDLIAPSTGHGRTVPSVR